VSRQQLANEPCVLGGTHKLTEPLLWIGASCRKCHRTWEGTGLTPTWPDPKGAHE
jgi:hypothetical protein